MALTLQKTRIKFFVALSNAACPCFPMIRWRLWFCEEYYRSDAGPFSFLSLFFHASCRILVSRPTLKPCALPWELGALSPGQPGNSWTLFCISFSIGWEQDGQLKSLKIPVIHHSNNEVSNSVHLFNQHWILLVSTYCKYKAKMTKRPVSEVHTLCLSKQTPVFPFRERFLMIRPPYFQSILPWN